MMEVPSCSMNSLLIRHQRKVLSNVFPIRNALFGAGFLSQVSRLLRSAQNDIPKQSSFAPREPIGNYRGEGKVKLCISS